MKETTGGYHIWHDLTPDGIKDDMRWLMNELLIRLEFEEVDHINRIDNIRERYFIRRIEK